MDLVIDANILFAALIKRNVTSDLLFKVDLYAPKFIFEELGKHKELIISKTKRSDEEFEHLLAVFKRRVVLIEIDAKHFKKAKNISPDPKDVPYLALALKLSIPLWSNDKKLKEQCSVRIVSTRELADVFLPDSCSLHDPA